MSSPPTAGYIRTDTGMHVNHMHIRILSGDDLEELHGAEFRGIVAASIDLTADVDHGRPSVDSYKGGVLVARGNKGMADVE